MLLSNFTNPIINRRALYSHLRYLGSIGDRRLYLPETLNVYILPLDQAEVFDKKVLMSGDLILSAATMQRDLEEFIQFHATAAHADGQPTETQELLVRTAAMDPRSTVYLAKVHGHVMCALNYAGSGLRERPWLPVCMTYPDSPGTLIMERLGYKPSSSFLLYVKEPSLVNALQLASIPWVATLFRDKAYTTLSSRVRYELNGVWGYLFLENTMKTSATTPERIYQSKGLQAADELRAFFKIMSLVTGAPATLMGGVGA